MKYDFFAENQIMSHVVTSDVSTKEKSLSLVVVTRRLTKSVKTKYKPLSLFFK